MVYMDLNIPYRESDRSISAAAKASSKATRLRLLQKAIELGYTGLAYNRTVNLTQRPGPITPSQAPLFALPEILHPSLLSSVGAHRRLLNVPLDSPFRQYTRLTLVVDCLRHFDALVTNFALIQTYNLVAVTPMNQDTFQHACQSAKVDIISIDFRNKLPFRLTKSMVKEAIERGVYFEITYSSLIFDVQARLQMIPNAKLLVDWTRGKNLIISSGAPSVTELRGPYDVANLSSLFGLTMDKSKAAISKNCRSVIANALRKKHFFKDAIKVEKLPPGEEMNFDDWLKWDPISIPEGELSLDDMGKAFSASCNILKATKAIDFASALNGIPSHGFQIKDIISSTVAGAAPFSVSEGLTTELVVLEKPPSFCSLHKKEPGVAEDLVGPCGSDLNLHVPLSFDLSKFVSSERNGNDAVSTEKLGKVQTLVSKKPEPRSLSTASDARNVLLNNEALITCAENTNMVPSHDQGASARKSTPASGFSSSPFDCEQFKLSNSARLNLFTQDKNVGRSLVEAIPNNFEELHEIEAERVHSSDKELPLASSEESLHDNSIEIERSLEASNALKQIEAKRVNKNDKELPPALCEKSLPDNRRGRDRSLEERDTSIVQIDRLPVDKFDDHTIIDNEHLICNNEAPSTPSYETIANGEDKVGTSDLLVAALDEPHVTDLCSYKKTEDVHSVGHDETVKQDIVTSQVQTDRRGGTNNKHPDNTPQGRGGVKRKTSQRISLFPFRRLISPRPSRKKARK